MTRPIPMLDAAIRDGSTRVIQNACAPVYGSCALLAGHDGPHHGYKRNIAQIVDLAGRQILRAAFPWTPTDAVIEAMARAIWRVRSTRDWFELEPEEMHHWHSVGLAAHRAIPIVRELWPEGEGL